MDIKLSHSNTFYSHSDTFWTSKREEMDFVSFMNLEKVLDATFWIENSIETCWKSMKWKNVLMNCVKRLCEDCIGCVTLLKGSKRLVLRGKRRMN